MSFLEGEVTLVEALAFIDSFDDISDVQTAPKTKKTRIRNPHSTSTALQRRQKAETLQLREQVAELQQQLQFLRNIQLQSYHNDEGSDTTDEGYLQKIKRKMRYDQAMTEYHERQKAEKDNRKLREMLASQLKFGEALSGLLQKQSVVLSFIQDKRPKVQRPLTDAAQFMVELETKVESMYSRSGALFQDGAASISSHTVVTNDEQRGKMIDMVMVTPMACSIKDAGRLMWGHYEESWDEGSHPNSLKKNYVTTATSSIGLLEFEKWNYARMFEESSRTVIVWANFIFLPEHDLKIHLMSSTVVSRSDAGPIGTSVARSFVQLYSEALRGDHGNTRTQESVLAFIGDVFRQHLRSQQNQLLQEVGQIERTLPILA